MIATALHDLRTAARSLLRAPLTTVATVLTLAIACAATLATWAMVEAVFLRALPYAQADRLLAVWVDASRIEGEIGIQDPRREWTSFDHYLDVRDNARSLEGIAAWRGWNPVLGDGRGEAERLVGGAATWNAFQVLGVQPVLGRGFAAEDGVIDAPMVAVIGHGLWQRRFNGDPDVIGRVVEFNRMRHTVVGVMPAGFRFPDLPEAEVFAVLQERTGDRGQAALRQFARLAPGVGIEQAQRELDLLAARLRRQYPDTQRGLGLFVEPLQASLGRHVRAQVLVLQAAALMVLLIATVNLASLAVARSAGRRGEFALRGILGASPWRQWRLLLAESLQLAVAGGLAGLLLAGVGLRLLTTLFPPGFAQAWDVQPGASAVLAAITLSGAVALVIAGASASATRRATLADANAQTGARSIGARAGNRLANALVAGNFALALAVTVASILLLDSHRRLQQVDLGFRPQGVVAGGLLLPSMAYPDDPELRGAQQRLRESLQAIPGVDAVAFSTSVPLSRSFSDALLHIEGQAGARADGRAHAWMNWVSHDFLDTLGVRLREGRGFNPGDASGHTRPAIVNAAFVRQHFDGRSPLGRRLGVDGDDGTQWFDIVGVVDDLRFFGVDQAQTPTAYLSLEAMPRRNLFLTVRSDSDPVAVMASMRQAVRQLDPVLAMADLRPLQDRVDAAIAMPRAISRITVLFALSGLLLAGIGVYSTLAHAVLRRTRELGLRRAMGADSGSVLTLVLGQALRPALLGLLPGLPLVWLLARELRVVLYETGPAQPSAWLPARRALRVEPLTALRQD